jgi:hypothetical protein
VLLGGTFLLLVALSAPAERLGPDYFPGPESPAAACEDTPTDVVVPSVAEPPRLRVQHVSRLGVGRWHAAGYRGHGLKIAVLDSGFRGYRDHLGQALPARVTARSFRHDGKLEAKDSQHGILCAEVIHALAPEAELLFANWEPDSSETFLQAVGWARRQGARILSCSIIMPSWSDGEGGGTVHAALARILGTGGDMGDLLCFACAGNTAQRHWTGPFHDNGDGFHAWQPGQTDNRLTPWGEDRVSVELCGQPGAGYEVSVYEDATSAEIGSCLVPSGLDPCCAIVRFQPKKGHTYRVRVRLASGSPRPFHLVALGASLESATARGSIPFPADGPAVLAVGAVNPEGQRIGYSSCGPNSPAPKPDLVAAVPFPSLWRSRPFSGTSAAAPQAAALAALWWSRHPDWTANQVRAALRTSARDLGPAGHDYETGYGLLRLP